MHDPRTLLEKLRRPALLVQAAHIGLNEYNRERSLAQLVPDALVLRSGQEMFATLAAQEEQMDAARRAGEATYSVARHIEVLIAMIVEARLVSRPVAT